MLGRFQRRPKGRRREFGRRRGTGGGDRLMQLTRRAVVVGQAIVLDVEEIYGEGRNREKDSHDKDPTCAS